MDSSRVINTYAADGTPAPRTAGAGLQPFKYNGNEWIRAGGLDAYDFNARLYHPAAAQFSSQDPLAENYYATSPYAFCGGNPVRYSDPTGMDWYQNTETKYYTWHNQDQEIEGYEHIGGKGSLLGEFEGMIDGILTKIADAESLYSEGFTLDIAPSDKGALIGSKERDWNFFDEFVTGTGPEFSILTPDHPYTRQLMERSEINDFQKRVRESENGKFGHASDLFRPWDASPFSTMQFIGSYYYLGERSSDGINLLNVVYDSKSGTSLFYHIPGISNHRRSENQEYGTTFQFYIWKSPR